MAKFEVLCDVSTPATFSFSLVPNFLILSRQFNFQTINAHFRFVAT